MISSVLSDRPTTPDGLVPPDLAAAIDRLDVQSRRIFGGTLPGERRSKQRGRSVEFDDYRLYTPGDDPRHLDWNVLARLDKLFVKLFREEQDLSVTLFVDMSPSMDSGRPSKLVFASRIAAAIGYLALVRQNRVSCAVYGASPGSVQQLAPTRGRPGARRLVRFLLDSMASIPASPGGRTAPTGTLNDALRLVAGTQRGRGVMIILSDFLDRTGWTTGLNAVFAAGGNGFDAWVMHTLSPAEIDPARERDSGLVGDVRLIDSETSASAEVTLSTDVMNAYRARVRGFCDQLRNDCRARGMRYLLTPSDSDVMQLMLTQLRSQGLLG